VIWWFQLHCQIQNQAKCSIRNLIREVVGISRRKHSHSSFFFTDAATETRYLNASNRELCPPIEARLSSDNPDPPPQENKAACQLLQFSFQELKAATGNFRPDSILGEGGFGYVFKGWIEEDGTSPAKPGSGITVAVKSLKPDGLQGHREWVVSKISALG